MDLKIFKPLWGHEGDLKAAVIQAHQAGFNGIEGGIPETASERLDFKNDLNEKNLDYIAEVTTAGSYVPDRDASLSQHLDDFSRKVEQSLQLDPLFITCLGGCDAWPETLSIRFFEKAIEIANQMEALVSFETHRGRSLFNPWVTKRIVEAIPDIRLTCDFSHWCVVCERLIDTERDILNDIAKNAFHIHARVGYEQGPQVPHPGAPEYHYALKAHQAWWELIWQSQSDQGRLITTLTPEFGPDGYLHHIPFTDQPVADLWTLNCWMAQEERQHFTTWQHTTHPSYSHKIVKTHHA